jgi:hypothetical protein
MNVVNCAAVAIVSQDKIAFPQPPAQKSFSHAVSRAAFTPKSLRPKRWRA